MQSFRQICQRQFVNWFFSSLLFLFLFQPLIAGVQEEINRLSLEEKENLQYFFSTAIKHDHLGHVLFFSNKPACLIAEPISIKNEKFIKGWNVLKEKEILFPHPNFIIHHEMVNFGHGENTLHIYVINKKTLNEHLSKSESQLKEMLGENFSKATFLKTLEEEKMGSFFKADPALIGFLMGFGIDSSHAFKQQKKLKVILCAHEGKIKFLDQSKCAIKGNVLPISFFGNPESEEVLSLQEKYANELDKIETSFNEKDVLRIALQALCE